MGSDTAKMTQKAPNAALGLIYKRVKMMKKLYLIISMLLLSFAAKSESIQLLDNESFALGLKSSTAQLIDVRTAKEFAQGHIEGAINIDVMSTDFESQIAQLDKDKPVYVYCRSGKRSAVAANTLAKQQFKEIYDLKGGYLTWPQ